ncbi:MAG TPA: iron-sulfur cluster assembly accessory protein [Patescibacteria group bacterium]|nr:iron-sulfur cluster assembly accessory protein [Patescibacteria group bacterium]
MDAPETPITLTDKAAAKLIEFRDADEKTRGKPLRLCVRGGGCHGFSHDLYFDDPKPDMDQVFDIKGVTVLVDAMSLMYLAGTELDYVEALDGSGFKFNNPNVKSTCGCGSSFSP